MNLPGTDKEKRELPTQQRVDTETSGPPLPKSRSSYRRSLFRILKIALYLVFLVGSTVGILFGLEKLAESMLRRTHYGEVYRQDFPMVRRDFTRPVSHYDYDFVPGVCLEYQNTKGNRFEYANNAGFREPRDIPMQKPADEYRVFLVGGSTAYGLGAVGEAASSLGSFYLEYRETISHMMEMILNAKSPIPGKKIKVYNTGVWGYAYQHHLMRYITKLRLYEPDLVISLDGANDLPLVSKIEPDWQYFGEGQYHQILKEIHSYNGPGLSSYLTLWLKNNTFLMTYLWSGRDLFQDLTVELHQAGLNRPQAAARTDSADLSVEERSRLVDRNISSVLRVVENLHSALENDGVPHIFALQPWFYLSKKPHHDKEKILAGLTGYRLYYGVPSDKMYQLLTARITESAHRRGYAVADFSDYFDDVNEWVFTDWCHLTPGANYLIARELSNLVKEHILGRPLTAADLISNKDSHFWDLVSVAKVVSAPKPESPEQGPENILTGYPGELLYSARLGTPGEDSAVVIDLGREHPVSRMRLVWGDEASVPEGWTVEASTDQSTWRPFLQGDRSGLDHFSRWPGFEYHAPEPIEARFLKYSQIANDAGVIKLRSWSVHR